MPFLRFLPLFLVCVAISVLGHAQGDGKAERIDALVSGYVAAELFSGNVLVVRGDDVVFRKSYGLANREWGVPNGEGTKFRIGSLTKQFTAVLILQLVQEKKLRLEGTLSEYLEWFPAESGGRVTIQHLLGHSSGLPNYTLDEAALDDIRAHELTPEELARRHCVRAPEFEPGSRFAYCNTGYFLLGVVIETLTHESFATVLQKRILDPAGMKDSGLDDPQRILPGRAAGYSYGLDGYENAEFINAGAAYLSAGGMYSTSGDLWRWERALRGDALLSPELRARRITPGLGNYGCGVYVNRMPDAAGTGTTTVVGHNGSLYGFTSNLTRWVEEDILVVLLDNTRAWDRSNPESIGAGIVAILRGKEPGPIVRSLKVVLTDRARTASGAELARLYRSLKSEGGTCDLSGADVVLNNLGYQLLQAGRTSDALALLHCGSEEFPARDYLLDSLGEAQVRAGELDAARASFKRALELAPGNTNARAWLEKLGPDDR